MAHVRQLLDAVGRDPKAVIGGDLNAHPDDPVALAIADDHLDLWVEVGEGPGLTMPAARPSARIDAIFAGSAVRALRAWMAGATASDHLTVVVDLELLA